MSHKVICDTAENWLRHADENSVDLIFGSPPYEDARTYGIDFSLKGEDWVAWMHDIVCESVRVSRGLAAFVVEGKTRQFRWSSTPVLLMADLHRSGIHLRKPPAYRRVGIPGSGGPDWLRNDYEFVVCATSGGRLPWSDNIAMGQPCKYKTGGALSHRHEDGRRKNARDKKRLSGNNGRPAIANPGNVIKCHGGGGHLGSKLAHENEAPFPENLAEFFVRSFCPPGGTVLDPFAGSGTVAAVAKRWGRNSISIDIRQSQVDLTKRRLAEVGG